MSFFFFFNDTATTEIYTLSLHDALPILIGELHVLTHPLVRVGLRQLRPLGLVRVDQARSEEHTSELQSRLHLVCRLLLEKKKKSNVHCQRGPPAQSYRACYKYTESDDTI